MKTITRRNHGRGHGYRDSDGDKITGVTTWLNQGTAKPALVNWAAKQAAAYAVDHWHELSEASVSERLRVIERNWRGANKTAMATGTQVHALAEHLIKGETVDVPEHVAGHVESYSRFLEEWDPDPIVVEGVIANLDVLPGYAGTLDLIADMRGERWLIDLKTGRGVYGEVGLQLAAYRYATILMDGSGDPQPMPEVDRCAVLHVTGDAYELRPVKADETVFMKFRYIQQSAIAITESKEWLGEALR